MYALSNADSTLRDLLVFRFAGNRYGGDWTLSGHKFGNLMLTALTSKMGSFTEALAYMQRLFKTTGIILPATSEGVKIKAVTTDGVIVEGEENIDLGKYNGKRSLERVYLVPKRAKASKEAIAAIKNADVIIAGPGDLYTTILPVLLVEEIRRGIEKSKALKLFIVNVANKPFETPQYKVSDYVNAIAKHCGSTLFRYFLVNTNHEPKIPRKFKYEYVILEKGSEQSLNGMVRTGDLVDEGFPLYHDPKKLSACIMRVIV